MKINLNLTTLALIFPILLEAQWTSQATGFKATRGIWDISIANENTAWAIAYDATRGINFPVPEFTKTSNGGKTWNPGSFPSGYIQANISALSDQIAWLGLNQRGNGDGAIFKTIDGGINWNELGQDEIYDDNSYLEFVHFWNENEGIAVGDPNPDEFEIYRTTDGGITWIPIPGDSIPDPLFGEYTYWRYNNIGNHIWFSTNKYRVFHSSDKGLTWTVGSTNFPVQTNPDYIDVAFWNENEGIARKLNVSKGINLNVARTMDGGMTWQPITVKGTFFGSQYSGIAYVPGTASTLISTGVQKTLPLGSSYSNDGGYTWTLIDTNVQHYITRFINSTTGWSAGFNSSDTTDGIFKFTGKLVGVKNSQSKKDISFSLFPNPSSGNIMINLANGENSDLYIQVFDLNGKLVFKQQFDIPGEFFMHGFDFSKLSKGEYLMKIDNGNLTHSEKFIIK